MKAIKNLNIKNVTHCFAHKKVLHNINLNIQEGNITAIVGRSGCGKSTLLNLVAKLIDLQSGSILNGFHDTGVLFQDPRLLPWKTVAENISWGLKAKKVAKHQRDKIGKDLAGEVGLLKEDFNKYPHELSGGMKQRVAMARSFATKPDLLLLDEPFSALDIGLKDELHQLLINKIEQQKLTVLFITHDLMEAVKLADHIVVLAHNPGRVVYTDTSELPRAQRNYQYQYTTVMKLLDIDVVKQAFRTNKLDD